MFIGKEQDIECGKCEMKCEYLVLIHFIPNLPWFEHVPLFGQMAAEQTFDFTVLNRLVYIPCLPDLVIPLQLCPLQPQCLLLQVALAHTVTALPPCKNRALPCLDEYATVETTQHPASSPLSPPARSEGAGSAALT